MERICGQGHVYNLGLAGTYICPLINSYKIIEGMIEIYKNLQYTKLSYMYKDADGCCIVYYRLDDRGEILC